MDVAVSSQALRESIEVCAVSEGGELLAVVPVMRSQTRLRGIPVRAVDAGCRLVAYHREFIVRSDDPRLVSQWLQAVLGGAWDLFRMNDVPAGSATAAALEALAGRLGAAIFSTRGESSPYIEIATDWPAYLRARGKKFRANVSRAFRRPSEFGTAEMVWFDSRAETARLLDAMLSIERASWKQAEGVAIADRDYELRYHQQLLPYLADSGMLLANVLYIDGKPVAYVLCCNAAGWVGQLKTSFDARVKDAGAAVVSASVMRAFELGAREYDFLGDADAHKLRWTSTVREHRNYLICAGSVRGRSAAIAERLARVLKEARHRANRARPATNEQD